MYVITQLKYWEKIEKNNDFSSFRKVKLNFYIQKEIKINSIYMYILLRWRIGKLFLMYIIINEIAAWGSSY